MIGVDTTAQDLFVLTGLAAALVLIWLAFDTNVQEWRQSFNFRRATYMLRVAIEDEIMRTRKWSEERRRRR